MHNQLEKIHAHMQREPLAVISNMGNSQNHPQSALIAFSQNKKLEIYFMTFIDSRKYANLTQNPSVSFVIGFGYTTIQYQGKAFLLEEEAIHDALAAFAEKETPCTFDFLSNPRARFFKTLPTWIRYSDYSVVPAEVFEEIGPF